MRPNISSKANLDQDVKAVHLKIKDYQCSKRDQTLYQCSECDQRFFSKQNLETHVKDIHFKTKAYHCSECAQNHTNLPIQSNFDVIYAEGHSGAFM